MGSNRKKKLKKATFQKVKLKVGKRLPKANVTDTRFKTRKIKIVGQLQRTEITDGNKVTKDISSILPKLHHYNANMRIATSSSLKDLLREHPELVEQHLSVLLEKVVELIVDADPKVRDMANELLLCIFSSVPMSQMAPFFGIVLSYLSCGMNHISKSIQISSLRTFDLLMSHCPHMLKNCSESLLDNFLNLMSKQRNEGIGKKGTPGDVGGKGRILSADPSANVSGDEWYHAVFQRLERFFRVILTSDDEGPRGISKALEVKDVLVSRIQRSNFELYSAHAYRIQPETICESVTNLEGCKLFIDDNKSKEMLSSLLPLLMQGWMASASQKESGQDLPSNVVEFRLCIASIVNIILNYFKKFCSDRALVKWFCKQSKRLLAIFMAHFPYSVISLKRKRKRPKLESDHARSAVELNILLCDIVTSYKIHVANAANKYYEPVCSYFLNIFDAKIDVNAKQLGIVCRALKILLLKSQKRKFTDEILENALELYKKFPRGNEKRALLETMFEDFAFDECYVHLRSCKSIREWMRLEAALLINANDANWKSFKIVRTMATRGLWEFLGDIFDNLPKILEQIDRLLVSEDRMTESQKILLELLYWSPEVDPNCFMSLISVFNSCKLPIPLVQYSFQMLNTRFLGDLNGNWCDGNAKYISFLLTAASGICKNELINLGNSARMKCSLFVVDGEEDCIDYHQKLADIATHYLMGATSVSQLGILCKTFISKFTSEFKILPLHTVICLCRLINKLWEKIPDCLLDCAAELCVALLKSFNSDIRNLVKTMIQFTKLQLALLNKLRDDIQDIAVKDYGKLYGEMLNAVVEMVPLDKLEMTAVREVLDGLEVVSEDYKQCKWWASVHYHLNAKLGATIV